MVKIVFEESEVYTVDEAAKLLGLGVATVWRRIKGKELIALRISGRTFVPKSEIERLTRG